MPATDTPKSPAVWTIKSLLEWTADFLTRKGIESPRLESQLLLAHVLKCKKIDLLVRYDEEPGEADRSAYRELITRRVDHWPTAYLTGTKEFFGLTFEVSPAVLIPRPETETLVLEAIRLIKTQESPAVLDLCTGSGCVAVSLACQHKAARVSAVDLSPDALEIARRNARRNGVEERIAFLQGDLFNAVSAGAAHDLIVSNPPYVTLAEMNELDPSIRDHEPRLALDGGPDGLAFHRRIAASAGAFLKPGGAVMVEIGAAQAEAVQALFAAQPGLELGKTWKDLAGIPRVVSARKKETTRTEG